MDRTRYSLEFADSSAQWLYRNSDIEIYAQLNKITSLKHYIWRSKKNHHKNGVWQGGRCLLAINTKALRDILMYILLSCGNDFISI